MTDTQKMILTSVYTIAGGVVVFALTQLFQEFCIKPLNTQAKAVGRVAFALLFHANVHSAPGKVDEDRAKAATREYRECAAELYSAANAVRWYPFCRALILTRSRQAIGEAVSSLIGLSNSVQGGRGMENFDDAAKIRQLLGLTKV